MDLLASGQAGQVFAASCPAAFSSYRRIVFCISRSSHVSKKGGGPTRAGPLSFHMGGVVTDRPASAADTRRRSGVYGELAVIDECDYNACQRLAFTGGRWSDRQDLAGDCTPGAPER